LAKKDGNYVAVATGVHVKGAHSTKKEEPVLIKNLQHKEATGKRGRGEGSIRKKGGLGV